MSAHTPGPWAVFDGAIYGAETGPVHNGKTCAEVGHDPTECGPSIVIPVAPGPLIDDIKAGHWDDCHGPREADLHLIAAAPELLEALSRIASKFGDMERAKLQEWEGGGTECFSDEGWNWAAAMKAVHDIAAPAIAKATGEQP